MKYTLTIPDLLRGLVVAVGTAVLMLLQQMLLSDPPVVHWGQLGLAAASAAIAYLLKNFLTDDVAKAKNTLKSVAVDSAEVRKVESIETKK